jgi:hypothetical protein
MIHRRLWILEKFIERNLFLSCIEPFIKLAVADKKSSESVVFQKELEKKSFIYTIFELRFFDLLPAE